MYQLNVEYPLEWEVSIEQLTNMDTTLQEAVGEEAGSSGAGFGARDLQWYFDTEAEAQAAKERIEALRLTDLQISIWNVDEEDEGKA